MSTGTLGARYLLHSHRGCNKTLDSSSCDFSSAARAEGGLGPSWGTVMKVRLACASALLVAGCLPVIPPPIGRDLPPEFAKANPIFNQHVKARFPVGSSESAMIMELRREHFKIGPLNPARPPDKYEFWASRSATITFGCGVEWDIFWTAKDDVITTIDGGYGDNCL